MAGALTRERTFSRHGEHQCLQLQTGAFGTRSKRKAAMLSTSKNPRPRRSIFSVTLIPSQGRRRGRFELVRSLGSLETQATRAASLRISTLKSTREAAPQSILTKRLNASLGAVAARHEALAPKRRKAG